MKKLLLIILLLSQPIYAEEAIEKEIAEFEANLAKELANKAAQEIMAEIEAEAVFKAKLEPTVCERTEGERISYLSYISGAVNSSDDL